MHVPPILACLFLAAALASCSGSMSAVEDESIVSSMSYDQVACDELAAARDRLADGFGLPRDTRRAGQDERAPMLGMVTPDLRARGTRDEARAISLLNAMNRSLERRRCGEEDGEDAEEEA